MNLITLQRKLWQYRQIHKLNELDSGVLGANWTIDLIPICTHKHYAMDDVWLKLLSLPNKSFERVLRLSILLLISMDRTISISGKKLQWLHKTFTKNELKLLKSSDETEINVEINLRNITTNLVSLVPNVFFETNNVLNQAGLALIARVYGNNKDIALTERYALRFEYGLQPDYRIVSFMNGLSVETLEGIILMALKMIMPNFSIGS
jgi:hypothetical protein